MTYPEYYPRFDTAGVGRGPGEGLGVGMDIAMVGGA